MPTDDEKFLQTLEIALARHENGNPWVDRVALWVGIVSLLGVAIASISAWNNITRDVAELRREFDVVRDHGSPAVRERLLHLELQLKK